MHSDRYVPLSEWEQYMKKYQDKYRMIRDEIGIWHIQCRRGTIQLFSLEHHRLSFVGEFNSPNEKTFFIKKQRFRFKIEQEGHDECIISFDESELNKNKKTLGVYNKRVYTAEALQRLRDNMNKARAHRIYERKMDRVVKRSCI